MGGFSFGLWFRVGGLARAGSQVVREDFRDSGSLVGSLEKGELSERFVVVAANDQGRQASLMKRRERLERAIPLHPHRLGARFRLTREGCGGNAA